MSNHFSITPTDKLLHQWCAHNGQHATLEEFWEHIAIQAAQWGADQELEACCSALNQAYLEPWQLRAARRPKPPSLKEQALEALKHVEEGWRPVPADCNIIRRALEALDD